jgi:uncharacterized protein YceK
MIRTAALLLAISVSLSGCGGSVTLKPKGSAAMPVAPEGAQKVPSAEDLMEPTTQARPTRSDEQLKRSEVRQDDAFDLPPTAR